MMEIEPDSSGEGLRVGIVRSRFNERIGVAMSPTRKNTTR